MNILLISVRDQDHTVKNMRVIDTIHNCGLKGVSMPTKKFQGYYTAWKILWGYTSGHEKLQAMQVK